MAKAFGVAHKCTLPIAGKPMLQWVLEALRKSSVAKPFVVSIDDSKAVSRADDTETLPSAVSAPASAIKAIQHIGSFPVLITTGDHPLLTPAMISHLQNESENSGADVLVGLAMAETIRAAYPDTKRTYFNLGGTRVSGCNLFAIRSAAGLKLLERWQDLEKNRKQPWKLVGAFGLKPIILFALGQLTPQRAFAQVSQKLGIKVEPVYMPFAEAAIDVDKPSDHALAEQILGKRSTPA
jgi:GTP:adenosylcobinamide-phosphate guanylyltransferase